MNKQYIQKNNSSIINIAKSVTLGKNIVFGPSCREISIGFGSFLGNDLYIDVPFLSIGEYTTIHHGTTLHGLKTIIGHNCWIGQYCIIDSLGGYTSIGNNVGIGAHSQLWSHMKFGDSMSGCLWNSSGKIILEDEVWLVGHTIIGPIKAEKQSMLLTGGVMMKNMSANAIYAGNPAKKLTNLGPQFKSITVKEKKKIFLSQLQEFKKLNPSFPIQKFIVVEEFSTDLFSKGITQFILKTQKYIPQYSVDEYRLIKFMLYDKAKFIPQRIV